MSSYFPYELEPASVAWEVGQKVSPVHFYALESHLRSHSLLPFVSTAPAAGVMRIPAESPGVAFSIHCDLVSAVHRVLHVEVSRCTGLTQTRQWIAVTQKVEGSQAIEQIENRWPDLYLTLHATGSMEQQTANNAPAGSGDAAALGRDLSHLTRRPAYEIRFTLHEPHTQKGLPTPGPDGLLFGRIVDRNGSYEVDPSFAPPVLHLRDLPAWSEKVAMIRQALHLCSDEIRGYFNAGLAFDPLKKKSHVLHHLALILAGMRGAGRNPWSLGLAFLDEIHGGFESISSFFAMHQGYLQSLDEDGSLMELVNRVHHTAQLLVRFAPGQAIVNAAPLLDAIHRSFPIIGQIAGRVRQSLEQDRRTPPDNHFIWKEPFFQLKHWSTRLFQKSLSGRIQLDIPRADIPGRVKFLRAISVLFYFQPIKLKDAYNTGDPQIRWRISEAEPWRETGILLREDPLRECANSVGYVGVLLDMTDINLESLDQVSIWLPGEDVPREARCYAHMDEPPPEEPTPEAPPSMPTPPPPSSPVW